MGLVINGSHCLLSGVSIVNIVLALVDGVIATTAYIQLARIHLRNRHVGWTRQKVFHFMIGSSNIGYFIYFTLMSIATCEGWTCWSHGCGFIVMALPQILFLAAFLLLLSFWLKTSVKDPLETFLKGRRREVNGIVKLPQPWQAREEKQRLSKEELQPLRVDLCHQATDKEEEEDEDDTDYLVLPEPQTNKPILNLHHAEKHWRCSSLWRHSHIRSRQKFVIAVVLLICVLTITFSVLIWVGMGSNSINSLTMAQIYSDLFAIVILMSGGGLACYGLLLYLKMSRVRSGKASADIQKVAGLAAVAVFCFTLRALLVLCTDVPVLNIWRPRHADRSQSPLLIFLYYFIGSSIPSTVVLWVMREMPPRPVDDGHMNTSILVEDDELVPDDTFVQHWISPSSGQDQIEVSYDCRPIPSNFQIRQESPR